MTLQTAAQQALHQMAMENWNWSSTASNDTKKRVYGELQKALADEQAHAGEPVATTMADHIKNECGYCEFHAVVPYGTKLYTHSALPATGEQIDWQDMYLKTKSEKEAMAAKYEKDIGPLEKVAPATDDHAPPRK